MKLGDITKALRDIVFTAQKNEPTPPTSDPTPTTSDPTPTTSDPTPTTSDPTPTTSDPTTTSQPTTTTSQPTTTTPQPTTTTPQQTTTTAEPTGGWERAANSPFLNNVFSDLAEGPKFSCFYNPFCKGCYQSETECLSFCGLDCGEDEEGSSTSGSSSCSGNSTRIRHSAGGSLKSHYVCCPSGQSAQTIFSGNSPGAECPKDSKLSLQYSFGLTQCFGCLPTPGGGSSSTTGGAGGGGSSSSQQTSSSSLEESSSSSSESSSSSSSITTGVCCVPSFVRGYNECQDTQFLISSAGKTVDAKGVPIEMNFDTCCKLGGVFVPENDCTNLPSGSRGSLCYDMDIGNAVKGCSLISSSSQSGLGDGYCCIVEKEGLIERSSCYDFSNNLITKFICEGKGGTYSSGGTCSKNADGSPVTAMRCQPAGGGSSTSGGGGGGGGGGSSTSGGGGGDGGGGGGGGGGSSTSGGGGGGSSTSGGGDGFGDDCIGCGYSSITSGESGTANSSSSVLPSSSSSDPCAGLTVGTPMCLSPSNCTYVKSTHPNGCPALYDCGCLFGGVCLPCPSSSSSSVESSSSSSILDCSGLSYSTPICFAPSDCTYVDSFHPNGCPKTSTCGCKSGDVCLPCVTPTPTANVTPTPTANVTPTPTANVTPTPTANVTPTPTANVTPTPTANVTPTPTANVTPTPNPSSTPMPINSYDTTLTVPSGSNRINGSGVTFVSNPGNSLSYNNINSTGTPVNVKLFVSNVQVALVTVMSYYIGQSFRFTTSVGASYQGTFEADGRVDF